jgi:AhpD family alkylhydroperoxidase
MVQRLDYQKLSAAGVRAVGGLYVYVSNSGLPKILLDLVFLRASQINGCAYCIGMHSRDLLKAGVSVEKVMLLAAWREAGEVFTAQERAALGWTEAVTLISERMRPTIPSPPCRPSSSPRRSATSPWRSA